MFYTCFKSIGTWIIVSFSPSRFGMPISYPMVKYRFYTFAVFSNSVLTGVFLNAVPVSLRNETLHKISRTILSEELIEKNKREYHPVFCLNKFKRNFLLLCVFSFVLFYFVLSFVFFVTDFTGVCRKTIFTRRNESTKKQCAFFHSMEWYFFNVFWRISRVYPVDLF